MRIGQIVEGCQILARQSEQNGITTYSATREGIALRLEETSMPLTDVEQGKLVRERSVSVPDVPQILQLLGCGVDLENQLVQGCCYLIVLDLGESITTTSVTTSQALWILREVAQGLAVLHAQGRVYGGVSRDTVTWDRAKRVALMPPAAVRMRLFMARGNLGAVSASGFAPEFTQSHQLLPASDIYALGCLAYELLVGEHPFRGSGETLRRAHLAFKPQKILDLAPMSGLPEELSELCARCLEKDPNARPTAQALVQELDAISKANERAAARFTGGMSAPVMNAFENAKDMPISPTPPPRLVAPPPPRANAASIAPPRVNAASIAPPSRVNAASIAPPSRTNAPLRISHLAIDSGDSLEMAMPQGQAFFVPTGGSSLTDDGFVAPQTAPSAKPSLNAAFSNDLSGFDSLQGDLNWSAAPEVAPVAEAKPAVSELELDNGYGFQAPNNASPSGSLELDLGGVAQPEPALALDDSQKISGTSESGMELDLSSRAHKPSATMSKVLQSKMTTGYRAPGATDDLEEAPEPPGRATVFPLGVVMALLLVSGLAIAFVFREQLVTFFGAGPEQNQEALSTLGATSAIEEAVTQVAAAEVKPAAVAEPELEPESAPEKPVYKAAEPLRKPAQVYKQAPTVSRYKPHESVIVETHVPATFSTETDPPEVICSDTDTCRVPIKYNIRVEAEDMETLILSSDDLYDRRSMHWSVVLQNAKNQKKSAKSKKK